MGDVLLPGLMRGREPLREAGSSQVTATSIAPRSCTRWRPWFIPHV